MPAAAFPFITPRGRLQGQWMRPRKVAGGHEKSVPVVLLHEGLGSIQQWRSRQIDFPQVLADRLRRPVFAYDRLGYGGADPLPGARTVDYLFEEAATVPAVLDAAGIDRAVLFGHSDGASIALLAASEASSRVAAIVSMAAHVILEDVTVAGVAAARAAFDAAGSRLRESLTRYHGEKTDFTFSQWADLWLSPEFRCFNIADRLPAIACPVLALQGMEDEYGSPEQIRIIEAGVTAGRKGDVATALLPGCRHAPQFQATETVLSLTEGFLFRNRHCTDDEDG